MILWDAGTSVTGEGTIAGTSAHLRVHVTATFANEGHSANLPPRYYNLGTVGQYAGDYRNPGTRLIYGDQQVGSEVTDADGWYYLLPAGVAATIYRGVAIMPDLPIGARVYRSTSQSIADNTSVVIDYQAAEYDPFNMWRTGVQPSMLYAPEPGFYVVGASLRWPANATGIRSIAIRQQNGPWLARNDQQAIAGGVLGVWQSVNAAAYIAKDQFIECVVFQNSGGALSLTVTANVRPDMWMARIG